VERYCERSRGTKAETATGKEHKCINNGWTGAVKKHRRVTLTLKDKKIKSQSKRHSKSHSKPEMGKKKMTCFLPLSKDCLQQGLKTQEEEMFSAAKRHFL